MAYRQIRQGLHHLLSCACSPRTDWSQPPPPLAAAAALSGGSGRRVIPRAALGSGRDAFTLQPPHRVRSLPPAPSIPPGHISSGLTSWFWGVGGEGGGRVGCVARHQRGCPCSRKACLSAAKGSKQAVSTKGSKQAVSTKETQRKAEKEASRLQHLWNKCGTSVEHL